jgi:hypothetical protein
MNKDDIISKLLSNLHTKEGKAKLAMAMAAPIRRNLDYRGIARSVFNTNPIYEIYDWKFHD